MPQIAPSTYRNAVTEASQNNFFQQQNQSQSQQQKHQFPLQQSPNHSIQSQFVSYPMNQQGNCYSNNPPPCQPNLLCSNQQPMQNSFQTQYPMAYSSPQAINNSQQPCGSILSPAALEQIRNACMTPTPPIFILPNNPTPVQAQQPQQMTGPLSNCPGMRVPCGTSSPLCYSPPSCFPYPIPMPMFNPFGAPTTKIKEITNCNCTPRRCNEPCKAPSCLSDCCTEHYCVATTDDTICAKKSCPSSINLQALASQLLAIKGIISCATTRLVLRKISGSNITNTMEETIERARRSIHALTQDQLLTESRNAQQINALINLHMTANPPANVIPILTTIQLKVNLLKSYVENLINCNLMENQSVGAEGSGCLDIMTLSLKCDKDLRTMLATLRQKECDERVNLNFAPYHSQRVIAECRLQNIESKIRQVEAEIARRRCVMVPKIPIRQEAPGVGCRGPWYTYPGTLPCLPPFERETIPQPQCCESPDPFQIQVRNTRRLNLKPHVGSPETTYSRGPGQMQNQRESIFAPKNKHQSDNNNNDGSCKQLNSHDEDVNNENDCDCCCDCSKSSDDDSPDEDKKKLRIIMKKTHRVNNDNMNIGTKKTVDFVRENMSFGHTINNVKLTEAEMEMPEKDTTYGRNNTSSIIHKENGNKFEENIVNNNMDESYKKEIILLHDSNKLKSCRKPSIYKMHCSESEKYSASFEMPVENILTYQSHSETANRIGKNSSNSMLAKKNSLNAFKSEKSLGENYMDFVVEDQLNDIARNMNDKACATN